MGEEIKGVEKLIQERDEQALQYYKGMGLPSLTVSHEADKYLHMNAQQMRALSRHECGEAAHFLLQECLYVQRQINQSKAKIDWCNAYIDSLICSTLSQFDRYVPKEIKRELAIKNNDTAIELNREVAKNTYDMNLISYVPTYLKSMSDVFLKLQDIKRGEG